MRRIHIIGAARSGTTMLHHALSAFAKTVLHDEETGAEFSPSIRRTIALLGRNLGKNGSLFFVTKREHGWFRAEKIRSLARYALSDGVGILNIIRDPRDALTSTHGAIDKQYYLEPERWIASVRATENLFRELSGHCPKLTIRYEDIILRPETAENELVEVFGLRLREDVASWASLEQNVRSIGVSPEMKLAMHGVRDFDRASIGRWRRDERSCRYIESMLCEPGLGDTLAKFVESNGYEP